MGGKRIVVLLFFFVFFNRKELKMSQKQKGRNRKWGRKKKKPSHKRYNTLGRRLKNKVKKVNRSSGPRAAVIYAREHGLIGFQPRPWKRRKAE